MNVKPCRIPGIPASPRNSAHSDQPKAASVPTDTSVSMVAAPCRRLVNAARWKGRPPQTTTGAARVSESHCQESNCRAGTIASSTTGRESSAETTRRCRSVSGSVMSAVVGGGAPPGARSGSGGGGTISSAV
ncbi:hypothetical protein SALBM135S_06589 [Streptomyces alboniger]